MGKLASHRALAGNKKKTSARGTQYGGKRNTQAKSAKQVTRKERRYQNGRVVEAMQEVHQQQELVEELVKQERPGAVPGALFRAREKSEVQVEVEVEVQPRPQPAQPRQRHRYEPYESDAKPGWTSADAVALIREGYSVRAVMRRTGVGWSRLEHLPIGEDGRIIESRADLC